MITRQAIVGVLILGKCVMDSLIVMPASRESGLTKVGQPDIVETVDVLLTKPGPPKPFKLQIGNGVGFTERHERAIKRIEDIIVNAQMRQANVEASPDGHALIAQDELSFFDGGQILIWPCWLDADEYFVIDEVIDAEFISDRHIIVTLESERFVIAVDRPEERIGVKLRLKQSCLVMNDKGGWAGITQDDRLLSGSSTDRLVIENDVEIEPNSTSGQRIGWIRNGAFFALVCKTDGRRMVRIYRPNGEFTGSEMEGYALLHAPIGSDTLFIETGERRYRLMRVNDNGECEMLKWWSGNNRGLVRPFAVSPSGQLAACWKEGLVPGASSAVIRKTDVGKIEDNVPEYAKGMVFAAWLRGDCSEH